MHLHRLDPEDRERLAQELDFPERVAEGVVVARLSYPRSFDALDAVRALVAADLGADEDGGAAIGKRGA